MVLRPRLVEVLHAEGIEDVRYALASMTGWHRDPCMWRSRRGIEKRVHREVWVRMEKTAVTVLQTRRKSGG